MKRKRNTNIIIVAILCLLSNISIAQDFTEILNLSSSSLGSVEFGDFDNDGDLDFFYINNTDNTQIARNNGHDNFTMISVNLASAYQGDGAWGDFDNDGDLDIALTGLTDGVPTTKIYRNDGWYIFTDINAGLTGVGHSTLAWGDYNNDGMLDLLVSGINDEEDALTTLYRNDSGAIFTDTKIPLTAGTDGEVQWGDFDNDELLDILLLGKDFNGNNRTEIYRNTGNDQFESIDAGFPRSFKGKAEFGDYDSDGDLDVAICGYETNGKIFKNNGDGTFSDINAGLVEVSSGTSIAWADYDNDGDLDIIISGLYSGEGITWLYTNEGSDTFVKASSNIIGLFNVSHSIGDYDNDDDVDLLLTGNDGPVFTGIYHNESSKTNNIPTPPSALQATVVNNGAILSWDPGSDKETPAAGLSYNIRIDTIQTGGGILHPMADSITGKRRIARIGNAGLDTDYYIKNLPPGKYYWNVQTIDGNYKASSFSTIDSFEILPTLTLLPEIIYSLRYPDISFADYNNDGFQDFIICGQHFSDGVSYTKIYKNNGDNTFDTINANLTGINEGSISWGDYDNDGDLDILMSGNTMIWQIDFDSYLITRIYRNDGNDVFTDIQAGIPGSITCDTEWGDIDNDGDLDFGVVGRNHTGIYRNDGNDVFTLLDVNIYGELRSELGFVDIDNDYDLDLITAGFYTEIWENEGNGFFTKIEDNLFRLTYGDVEFNDISNDGDLDLLVGGQIDEWSSMTIFENEEGVFTELDLGIRGVSQASVFPGDFNNDGFLDILYSGTSGTFISKFYMNDQQGGFIDKRLDMAVGWPQAVSGGDIDNDGDLDLLIASYSDDSTSLYRNNMNFPKIVPGPPKSLSSENSGLGIILNWTPPHNFSDGVSNLSYNVRLGSSPGSADIMSPMTVTTSSTKRLVNQLGNAQKNLGWKIESLPVGNYYWSVQAIDNSYYGGEWSTEQSFTITQMRPFFSSIVACIGEVSRFTDETLVTGTQVASWSWDFGDGSNSTQQNPSYIFSQAGEHTVTLTVTDTAGVSLDKTNPVYVLPKPIADFAVSDICIGSLASVVNTSDTDTLNIDSWHWDYGDGSTFSSQTPGPYGYLLVGTYNINLSVSAQNGCADNITKEIIVAEYPVSNIAVGGNTKFCQGEDVKLIVPKNSDFDYQWKIGGAPLAGADSSVHYANISGDYTVIVNNRIVGCTSESLIPITITVSPGPPSPLILVDDLTTFCDGDSLKLSVTHQDDYTYHWKLNDGAVGTNSNTYYAKTEGSYTLEILNPTGCPTTSPDTVAVTILEAPLPPNLNQSGLLDFCVGDSVTLSVAEPGTYSYQWMSELGEVDGGDGTSIRIRESGVYRVIRSADICSSSSQEKKVIVNAFPATPVILSENYEKDACQSDRPITLSVETVESDVIFQWKRNGSIISGETSNSYTAYLVEGDYSVEVMNGNCAVESQTLTISYAEMPDKPEIHAEGPAIWYLACSNDSASAYKWYLDGKLLNGAEDYLYVAGTLEGKFEVAISENGSCFAMSDPVWIPLGTAIDVDPWENLKIYPNPTPGLFTLEMDNHIMGELIIDIFGETGSKIINIKFQKETAHFKTQIDLSGQPAAAYFIGLMLEEYQTNRTLIVE